MSRPLFRLSHFQLGQICSGVFYKLFEATRGQGPYRPAATRAMNDGQIALKRYIEVRNKIYVFYNFINIILPETAFLTTYEIIKGPPWPQNSNLTSVLKSGTSITLVSMCILSLTAISVASETRVASKWPPQPQRSNLNTDLKSTTSITLVSMCILPLTDILVAFEAMAASKWPRRLFPTSELNSVTSITYVTMSIWLPKGSMS